jgi:hypothetical protein
MHLGIACLAGILGRRRRIDDPAFNGICRAAEAIGMFGVPNFVLEASCSEAASTRPTFARCSAP